MSRMPKPVHILGVCWDNCNQALKLNIILNFMNNLTTSPVAQYCMQIKDKASTSVKVVSTEDNRRTRQNSMPQSQR